MRILFLGGPGTGKSTAGKRLAETLGWPWVSSGELLRESKEPWVIEKLKTAELFDDGMVAELVLPRVESVPNAIIDGFPRTLKQAKIMVDRGVRIDLILEMEIPLEEAVVRLEARGREQDTPEIIAERYQMYSQTKGEILAFLAGYGIKVEPIDGMGTMDEVFARVQERVLAALKAAVSASAEGAADASSTPNTPSAPGN
ncbi:nucleoside monophosphate kinase [Candidatus Saccharibacteria bacterium]|nr:nucleoside monophosphate kinase [Candidatus Saccharibacteria bacterium]